MKRECEESLWRLRTNVIDLYQIHWPNPEEEIEVGWSEGRAEGRRGAADLKLGEDELDEIEAFLKQNP